MNLAMALDGQDLVSLMRGVVESRLFHATNPLTLTVDDKQKPITPDWIERWGKACKRSVFADWDRGDEAMHNGFVSIDARTVVKAETTVGAIDTGRVLAVLSVLPFELASVATAHREWRREPFDYRAPGFANLHWSHGWACAFKGPGHNRLVSRRWLDHGPWLVRRGANDTTLVQFHDLDADPATALEQAKPAHDRMGISESGGFLQWPGYVMKHRIEGLYVPDKRELRIVVHGRDVSESEMTDAAAMRAFNGYGDDKPIDKVIYVFMDEGAARAHLHQLWLRDIEVRAIVHGAETRIDEGYALVATKPEWVKRVEERERAR
jgi:hypothetical protein